MTPGWPLSLAATLGAAALMVGARAPRSWLTLNAAAMLCSAIAAVQVLAGAPWECTGAFVLGGEPVHLRLDAISAWFLLLLSVGGAAGAAFGHEYWSQSAHPRSAPRGRVAWSALLLSMTGVLVASNGLHFLIAWELFTLSAFFLITLERHRRVVRATGWLYLAASHCGTLFLFAFFASLAARTGSWDLGPALRDQVPGTLFWLALAGFAVKAGMFPLHVWLPSAHANAPSHVSAILSGVAIKMGVYGLVRFSGWLPVTPAAGWAVIGLGTVGALLGIAFALGQNDLKRLLAYSSVENIGVILIGLGAALLAAQDDRAWGRLALAGALLHILNHGLFKALLFYGAGSVLHATGTREMSRLGGLWRAMPWTAALFAVGAMAVSALPPLNGFLSEWLIYLALFDSAMARGPLAWATMLAAIILAMTGALALATFIKASAIVFLGAPRTKAVAHAHECGRWMRLPMIALATGCLLLAFLPALVWPALDRAAAAWHPAWTPAPPPVPLVTVGTAQAALAGLVAVAAVLLWRRSRRLGLRRAGTWDCGYAAPTARMQYTSGSFAGLAQRWFAPVLRPQRTLRRPRGPFPEQATHLERVPETVLELVLGPVTTATLRVSTWVRRLQHGRIQFYIVYVLAGLSGLAALAIGGAK